MIGQAHIHISDRRAVNKHDCCCESLLGFFCEDETSQSPNCLALDFGCTAAIWASNGSFPVDFG